MGKKKALNCCFFYFMERVPIYNDNMRESQDEEYLFIFLFFIKMMRSGLLRAMYTRLLSTVNYAFYKMSKPLVIYFCQRNIERLLVSRKFMPKYLIFFFSIVDKNCLCNMHLNYYSNVYFSHGWKSRLFHVFLYYIIIILLK